MRQPSPSNRDPAWHRHIDAEFLYHYTTWHGLKGILSSGCLWATDVRHLNDTSEFRYAKKLAVDKLHEIRKFQTSGPHIRECSAAIRAVQRLNTQVFAASLAVGGNLLSLWECYCRPRNGYAIEFAREALQGGVQRHGCRLKCVVYSPGAQWECLHGVEARAAVQRGPDPDPRKFAKSYVENFLQLAPFLKSPAFFEEGEWRIVPGHGPYEVEYRPGTGGQKIPYVSIPLFDDRGRLLVESILVGPDPERSFDHRAVRAFCRSLGIHAPVHVNDIPYRAK